MMKNIHILLLTLGTLLCGVSNAQNLSQPKAPQDWVISKNYYATYILLQDSIANTRIFQDKEIQKHLSKRFDRLNNAKDCTDLTCYINAFKWTDDEIEQFTQLLVQQFDSNESFKKLVLNDLLPNQKYGLSKGVDAKVYLQKAILQDFKAINYTIDVYGAAKKPNYPRIDSISFDVSKRSYLALMGDVRQDIVQDIRSPKAYFNASLLAAVRLLEMNERWDAALLEPMIEKENKKAFEAIQKTDFSKYPYSVMLMLGSGPEKYDQPISPGGMLRTRAAARGYFEGLAPFIIVSGGRVHPYKTPYIEAIEMKRYLMETHHVPESAIIIDPHARHTTTNMRNAARLMLTYGIPEDKFGIVSSSISHINSVEKMANRCIKELGYVPYTLGKRISDIHLEFKPNWESLTIDPDEPLDP